jgi:hypothetical protein
LIEERNQGFRDGFFSLISLRSVKATSGGKLCSKGAAEAGPVYYRTVKYGHDIIRYVLNVLFTSSGELRGHELY